jgi:acetyl esterase/lipase
LFTARWIGRRSTPHTIIPSRWPTAADISLIGCAAARRFARTPDHLDLVYGDAPRTRLDFFTTNRTAAPTLLFFHGGYWQRNAKDGFSFVAEGPLTHGFQCRGRGLHVGA